MLEALERDFQQVLVEMTGDQSIERFRKQFSKLYEALRQSHENERLLLQKSKELKTQISKSQGMIRSAIGLNQNDSTRINILVAELESAKNVIASMKEKEEKSKATIDNLKSLNENLEGLIIESENAQSGNTTKMNELIQNTNHLTKECDEVEKEVETLKESKFQFLGEEKVLQNTHLNLESQIKKSEGIKVETEQRLKQAEERMKNHEASMLKISHEIGVIEEERKKERQEIDNLKAIHQAKKTEDVRFQEENKSENETKSRIEKEYKKLRERIGSLKKSNKYLRIDRDSNDKLITKQRGEYQDSNMKLRQLVKKVNQKNAEIRLTVNAKESLIKKHQVQRNEIGELQREIEQGKKQAIHDRALIKTMVKDQENIIRNFRGIAQEYSDQLKMIDQHKAKYQLLDLQAKDNDEEIEKKQKVIGSLKVENEKRGKEAAKAIQKFMHLQEEIKLKDNLISEFQKKTLETEAKLKQQHQLYEAVRSDRNLYSKNLTDTQDEIAEIKLRYKIVMHQIAQLKEEIDAKDKALNQETTKKKDLKKEKQKKDKTNEKLKKYIDDRVQTIKNSRNEIKKLQSIITESENERGVLKKQYEGVVSERDILGTQLIRRNDGLALIYEKIKMQQNALAKGESEYRERQSDIKILDNTIKDLRREIKINKERALSLNNYHGLIGNLNKELVEEKLKVKALSEELENPKNIHRWRKLKGSDCDFNEMIGKIEALQKRLISKTEDVVSKDLIINTQEQTVKNLKQVMTRQPGLAEAEMISEYQQTIKSKTRKLKVSTYLARNLTFRLQLRN